MTFIFTRLWVALSFFQFSLYSRSVWIFVVDFIKFVSISFRPLLFFIISIIRLAIFFMRLHMITIVIIFIVLQKLVTF